MDTKEVINTPLYSKEKTTALLQDIFEDKSWEHECQEDGDLIVTYQGEHFVIEIARNGCHFRIWDLRWHEVSLENLANFALMRKAVNECNESSNAVLIYGINEEEHEMYIHTRKDIDWIPLISDLKTYLQNVLEAMLADHHRFYQTIENLRQEEYAKQN